MVTIEIFCDKINQNVGFLFNFEQIPRSSKKALGILGLRGWTTKSNKSFQMMNKCHADTSSGEGFLVEKVQTQL